MSGYCLCRGGRQVRITDLAGNRSCIPGRRVGDRRLSAVKSEDVEHEH